MKLSTDTIKNLMNTWLPQLPKEDLEHYAERTGWFDGEKPSEQEIIDTVAADFGFRKGATKAELMDHIYKLWCDGSKWKRNEKHTLKEEWETWLVKVDYSYPEWEKIRASWIEAGRDHANFPEPPKKPVTEFNIDVIGGQDDALLAKYSGPLNEALARKCVYRCFVHANDNFADNYRLEVITTPDDDAVIGWSVTVD